MYLTGLLATEEKGNANNYMNWQRAVPCSARQIVQRIQHFPWCSQLQPFKIGHYFPWTDNCSL